jgi:hypothetical protein
LGADLGHQEDLVAPTFEVQAEPGLGFAAIVFPAIVVKGDAPIEGTTNDYRKLLFSVYFRAQKARREYTQRTRESYVDVFELQGSELLKPSSVPGCAVVGPNGNKGSDPDYRNQV